ncbi:MAG: type II CAAX endopeptidase family protein [Acidimicrobiia bacterium]
MAAIVGGALVLIAAGYTEGDAIDVAPLSVLFLLQIPLWLGYGGVPWWVSRTKGFGLTYDFGWKFTKQDVFYGLGLGLIIQLFVIPVIYIPIFWIFGEHDVSEAARQLTDRATTPVDVATLVLVVAIGAPFIEELFFRGLFLQSVRKRFGNAIAIVATAVIFGAVHLQLLQFPALAVFGAIVAWLTIKSERLGPAVFTHMGFNLVTVVALLISAS